MLGMHHAIFWHSILGCSHGLGKYLTAKDSLVGTLGSLAAIDILINLLQRKCIQKLL
jgi:hypothetical protein